MDQAGRVQKKEQVPTVAGNRIQVYHAVYCCDKLHSELCYMKGGLMYKSPIAASFILCFVVLFSAYIWKTNYSHVSFADTGVPIWLFALVFISAVFTRSSLPSSLLLLKPLFSTVIESYGNLVCPSLGNRFS